MVRIAIVEDTLVDAEKLKSYVNESAQSLGEEVQVVHFSSAITFLDKYSADYDIVFMDIDMPNMNGMDASEKLREIDERVVLIFVTNLAKYAIKGYKVQAFDFVVKPVTYHDFNLKFRRAIKAIDRTRDTIINVKVKNGLARLSVADVIYVEVFGNELIYHTKTENYKTVGHLSQVQDVLTEADFFQCNRCYMINLHYVTSVKDFSVIVNGEELQISRRRKREFMAALTRFFSRGK